MAFSPEAPLFAPAFNIAPVAMAFVPKPMISTSSPNASRRRLMITAPIPPPCPSITVIKLFFFSIVGQIKKPLFSSSFVRSLTFVANFYINGMKEFVNKYFGLRAKIFFNGVYNTLRHLFLELTPVEKTFLFSIRNVSHLD